MLSPIVLSDATGWELSLPRPALPLGLSLDERVWNGSRHIPAMEELAKCGGMLRFARHDLRNQPEQPGVTELRDRVVVGALGNLLEIDQQPQAVALAPQMGQARRG